jgi:hypothetical protein
MAQLDRRDRVTICAGALLLLGVLVLAVSLLLMAPVPAFAGALVAGCGAGVLAGQHRLARRTSN